MCEERNVDTEDCGMSVRMWSRKVRWHQWEVLGVRVKGVRSDGEGC